MERTSELRDRYDLKKKKSISFLGFFVLGFFFLFLPTWFEQVFSQLSGCT